MQNNFISGGEKVVTALMPDNTYPKNTDFEAAFFNVSVDMDLSEQDCRKGYEYGTSGKPLAATETIKGVIFYRGQFGGAAAGHQSQDVYFHVFHNGRCYELIEGLRTGGYGASESKTQQVNFQKVLNQLDQVLATFQFASPVQSTTDSWNLYTDTTNGFQMRLPNEYKIIETTTDPKGVLVLTNDAKQFNKNVQNPVAELVTDIFLYQKQPVNQVQACRQTRTERGADWPCDVFAQDAFLNLQQKISASDIGSSLSSPVLPDGGIKGTVVDLHGRNGLVVWSRNIQAPGSTISLFWFDQNSNLIRIYQELADSNQGDAAQSQQYKTFLDIISTFRFTK